MIKPDHPPQINTFENKTEAPKRGLPLSELVQKESALFDEDTLKTLSLIFEENPHLSNIEVFKISPKDEPNTGGYFHRLKINENTFIPSIFIVEKDDEHMKKILKTREPSARRVAELLGINFSDLTPDLLRQFIISHELGHASDYVKNYENNPKNEGGDAANEWNLHYEANLTNLPVPGFDPVDLRYEFQYFDTLEQFIEAYPDTRTTFDSKRVTTLSELLRLQEQAYRESEYERYADNFATDFLKKNKDKLEQATKKKKAA